VVDGLLVSLPGVGRKTYQRLVEFFGSEERVLDVVRSLDLSSLLEVPGFSDKKAINFFRRAFFSLSGCSDVLKTRDAVRVYERLIHLVSEFVVTQRGKTLLWGFFPLPPAGVEHIHRRHEKLSRMVSILSKMGEQKVLKFKKLLKELKPLRKPRFLRFVDQAIIPANQEIYEQLRANPALRSLPVLFPVPSAEELVHYSNTYDLLVYIRGANDPLPEGLGEIENLEVLTEPKEAEILPEKVLGYFLENHDTIRVAWEILGLVPEERCVSMHKKLGMIFSVVKELSKLEQGRRLVANISKSFHRVLGEVNLRVEKILGDSTITLGGEELVTLLQRSRDVPTALRERLSAGVQPKVEKVVREAATRVASQTGLGEEWIPRLEEVFNLQAIYPVELDEHLLGEVEARAQKHYHQLTRRKYRAIAEKLVGEEKTAEEALRMIYELDVWLGLALFTVRYGLTRPGMVEHGIGFKGGRNIFLLETAGGGRKAVEPVDYELGDTPLGMGDRSRVALLTGANSGGKTTLLELLLQVQIMGQSGLFVPAEKAYVPTVDSIYYFSRSRTGTDAGAFEGLLYNLSETVSQDAGKSLVLADELEAVTEPGAAAKVIAAYLDLLVKTDVLGVIVTHLGLELRDRLPSGVRIDGIEATGLDADMRLVVKRSPVFNHVASSTPELVIRRVSKLEKNPARKNFFMSLLASFEG